MYEVRRWHLAVPMYEVRSTMYDLGSSRACARIWRSRNGGGIMEQRTNVVRKRREAVAGGACPVAPRGAYVRWTMYDVRLQSSRALRGDAVAASRQRGCVARRVKTGDGPKQPQGGCSSQL